VRLIYGQGKCLDRDWQVDADGLDVLAVFDNDQCSTMTRPPTRTTSSACCPP